jgi:elongation factor Ts
MEIRKVEITAVMVKELRQMTGAGILDCKKMLVETDGDMEHAVERLREKGLAKAAQKAGREAKDGLIGQYVHAGDRVAGMVEVNCETDFVARTPEFQSFVHDIAMQVVAAKPLYVSMQDVPAEVVEREKATYREQMAGEGKPEHILDRIIEGKMRKYYEDMCLLEQPFIKDEDKKIGLLLNEMIAQLGENIIIRRFVRFEVGE